VRLQVKVIPRSSRNRVAGWVGETLKVCVTVPPERGKANDAVEELLAGALGVARERICLVAGRTSTRKIIEIAGLEPSEVRRLLSPGTGDATP
jgi:uncharacterized protein